jgi:hypothetical protein
MLESEVSLGAVSSEHNDESYLIQLLMHLFIDEFSFFDVLAVTLDYYKYKLKYDVVLFLLYLNKNIFSFPLYLTFTCNEESSNLFIYF